MAFKQFALDERHTVTVYKRKTSRSLRLSVTPGGDIKVSIPSWTPYAAGLKFAQSRLDWILAQRKPKALLIHGQAVGKAHHLYLLPSPGAKRITSRVTSTQVVVKFPAALPADDPKVQSTAEQACIRALRTQAERLLPQRLADLAHQHGFSYKSVRVKQLKSRWGSCDQHKNIVLNLYLMQLPWPNVDYVLLHELTHTTIMQHGPVFWDAMRTVVPNLTAIRKSMRACQPILDSGPGQIVS